MTITTEAEVQANAMSKNELNYGLALLAMKIDFDMQWTLGQWGMRGSQRIDFVAYVPPRPAGIFIQGSYWHGGRSNSEDELKQAAAEQAGFWVVLVSEEDSSTVEMAKAHAKRTFA
jgi:hypothetical protein